MNITQVTLDSRLKTIADLIRPGKVVADIGTDHALLPCYLRQREQNKIIIASDINANPLQSAEKTLKQYGVTDVDLILSDGLKNIPYAEDIIIAGMGGETILKIISELPEKNYLNSELRLILQPMTRHSELRRGVYRLGFEILNETSAHAGKKVYTVIYSAYTGVITEINDLFAHIGLQKDTAYIKAQLIKIKKRIPAESNYIKLAEEVEKILYETEKNL